MAEYCGLRDVLEEGPAVQLGYCNQENKPASDQLIVHEIQLYTDETVMTFVFGGAKLTR